LPLFFLCVLTNIEYICVAVFIPENEDIASLSKVLGLLKNKKPKWNPRNMMVEITAIGERFPSKRMNNFCTVIYFYELMK
jgi:hypothetical protein